MKYTILFCFIFAFHITRAFKFSKSNEPGTPCSTNTSMAWLDMIFIIDVSTNMGGDNLKQLGISLASEITKFSISQSLIYNSRVAIITYADKSKTVAKWADFQNTQSAANAFLTLSTLASASPSVAGLEKAINDVYYMILDHNASNRNRPIVTIFIAASVKDANVNQQLLNFVTGSSSPITINYNPSDTQLTTFLNGITTNYNFVKDANLYANVEWAMMQANCFCGGSLQFEIVDPSINRTQFYADCYEVAEYNPYPSYNISNLCNEALADDNYMSIPIFIESKEKLEFISTNDYFIDAIRKFYIGLHRISGNFVWFNYDWSEFTLGNFTAWASGNGNNSQGDCVVINRKKNNEMFAWETTSCDTTKSNVMGVVCSHHACDAEHYCY